MVAVWAVIIVLALHWFSDFVWQPHWMSLRKSKENWVLAQHSARIFAGSLIAALFVAAFSNNITWWGISMFAAVNGLSHYWVDFVTSRITSKLWREEKVHNFFVVIGFDQFLHMTIAVSTLLWVVS